MPRYVEEHISRIQHHASEFERMLRDQGRQLAETIDDIRDSRFDIYQRKFQAFDVHKIAHVTSGHALQVLGTMRKKAERSADFAAQQ